MPAREYALGDTRPSLLGSGGYNATKGDAVWAWCLDFCESCVSPLGSEYRDDVSRTVLGRGNYFGETCFRSLAAEGRVYDAGGAAHVHGVTLSGNSALTIGSGGHNDDEGDAIRLRDEAFGETGAVSLASERRDNGDGGVLQLPDRGLDGGLDGSSVLSLGSGEHTDEEGDEVRVRGSAVGGTRVSSLGSGLRVNDKDGVARVRDGAFGGTRVSSFCPGGRDDDVGCAVQLRDDTFGWASGSFLGSEGRDVHV